MIVRVPVVLVSGVPVVLVPDGVHATHVTGAVDQLWWPGNGALERVILGVPWNPVRAWLDTDSVWEMFTALDPVRGEVRVEPLRVDLFSNPEVTQLLAGDRARVTRLLAGDVSPGATSIALDSTVGIPPMGVAHVGREATVYALSGGGGLGLVTRGQFGSRAQRHAWDPRTPPVVTLCPVSAPWPRWLHGRLATVWVARLDAGTLVQPTLWATGVVGAGVVRGSRGTRWSITLDPPLDALRRRAVSRTVRVTGVSAVDALVWDAPVPRVDAVDVAPWYASWDAVVDAWTRHAQSVGWNARAANQRGRLIVSGLGLPPDSVVEVSGGWSRAGGLHRASGTGALVADLGPVPDAWVDLGYPLPLAAPGAAAAIPTVLEHTYGDATARYALLGPEGLRLELLERYVDRGVAMVRTSGGVGRVLLERTELRLAVVARGPALDALRAAALALDAMDGLALEPVVDWGAIRGVLDAVPLSALPAERVYTLGDREALMQLLRDELLLRGCTLAVRRGRVAAVRVADVAQTEDVATDVREGDVVCDGGAPVEPELNVPSPVATALQFRVRGGHQITWVDVTHAAEFGDGETLGCAALERVPEDVPLDALESALRQSAQQVLGVLARPLRVVRVTLTGDHVGLAPGDHVRIWHPRIASGDGTLGVDGVLGTVVEVREQRWGGRWRVEVALRLAPAWLAGYAPEVLVAPGGVDGATVTVDTDSAWGADCWARTGRGPLDGWSAGDRVAVVHLARDPLPPDVRVVTWVGTSSITLDAPVSAGMAAAAAARYAVALRWRDWGVVTPRQRQWLYAADSATQMLGGVAPARRWGA